MQNVKLTAPYRIIISNNVLAYSYVRARNCYKYKGWGRYGGIRYSNVSNARVTGPVPAPSLRPN